METVLSWRGSPSQSLRALRMYDKSAGTELRRKTAAVHETISLSLADTAPGHPATRGAPMAKQVRETHTQTPLKRMETRGKRRDRKGHTCATPSLRFLRSRQSDGLGPSE
eukprot:2789669-Pyramimonas_sp.AAC.1